MLSALMKQSVANTWHCCSTWHNGDKQMSKTLEEYVAKRTAEVVAVSKLSANIDNIKSLMQTMHLSATEAMDALRVDETKRSQYMALL